MEAKSILFDKLEAFIKRYYTNELLKGTILFLGLGLLYFIFTFLVEYFLWLPVLGRTFLFWSFVFVEIFLLLRFILFPVFKLFKLQKGLNYEEASFIIGNHFSEVKDKLTNFLQLTNQKSFQNSDLLLASIQQKEAMLSPIPFSNAINFKANRKYIPYVVIPTLLLVLFFVTGNQKIILQSVDRVVHFNTKFVPPAPFHFVIENKKLVTEQNQNFVLELKTIGKIVPYRVSIFISEEEYILENTGVGAFRYVFERVNQPIPFYFKANDVVSSDFVLNVEAVPSIQNFEMQLIYPSYLQKKAEIVQGTGNAIVPEGTTIQWKIATENTNTIGFVANTLKSSYTSSNNSFVFAKKFIQSSDYQIITSNNKRKEFEKLNYQISIIKDQFPTISTTKLPDSLGLKNTIVTGQLSDDYGLSKLQVVYYPKGKNNELKRGSLPIKRQIIDQFFYSFPNGLDVIEGVSYEYYFEVFDNDAVNNFKSTKSTVFSHYELTEVQQQDAQLKDQNNTINSLEKSLNNQDKQLQDLEKLQKLQKEKTNFDFKDKKKIEDFIKNQQKQDEMMKEFTEKLSENLENFNPKEEDKQKEELIRRLDEAQKKAEENEKLLKELEDLQNKLQTEELLDKSEKLKKNAKSQTKNLEQLVELTKRFYIEKKAEQIADKLEKLADKQDKLAEDKSKTIEEQKNIAKEFDKIQNELNDLDKENKELKDPMDIPNDANEQESIEEDLEKSEESIERKDTSKASKSQKSAAEKMKEMGEKMSMSMEGGDGEQMEEDIETLRQILDNLLAFSFAEETLLNQTKTAYSNSLATNKVLKKQQDLKQQFQHIDDSIFAVSMRNPMITEVVLNEIGEVHYNIDKSLSTIADNKVFLGASSQQYVLSSVNKLADMLSNIQSNMQMQMSGKGKPKPGKGQSGEKQLADIIKKQDGLSKKMADGIKDGGKKEGDKSGEKPGEKPGSSGGKGAEGESGEDGNSGKLLEILKEQQQLRDALQKSLEQQGINGNSVLNQMKEIEKQLINKGFKNETLQKMLQVKHELLKLETAIQQQGEDTKRKSNSTKDSFSNDANKLPQKVQDYLKSIEILNRQTLPLQPIFNQRVNNFFNKND